MGNKYGWVPSKPHQIASATKYQMALSAVKVPQPTIVDLESKCPAIYDQGNLGSCTANAAGGLAQFLMKKLKYIDYIPSRLALYWWNRYQEGTVNEDSGASLYDAMRTLIIYGVPHESLWPYVISRYRTRPSSAVVTDGKNHLVAQMLYVPNDLTHLKDVLAQGYPFVFGFLVYESFEEIDSSGIMPMPDENNEEILGGHAVMAVGYNDETRMFKIRNSWGRRWGRNGYFYMPYDFITNDDFAGDFWTARNFSKFKSKARVSKSFIQEKMRKLYRLQGKK